MNNRGAALIAVICMLVVLSLLGTALILLVVMDVHTGVGDVRSAQALGLAEAGIEYGLWSLHADFDRVWSPDPATERFPGGGSFTLELVSNPDGTEVLRSYGYVPNRTAALASRVIEVSGDLVPAPLHPFYAHGFWFGNASELDYGRYSLVIVGKGGGDMYVTGDATFRNGADRVIDGAVRATGAVTKDSWSGRDPWKQKEEGVEECGVPPLDDKAREWYAGHAYSVQTGDQTISSDLDLADGRVCLVEGNLTIAGDIGISGDGALVATGDITVSGTIAYKKKSDGPVGLVAFGDIHCTRHTDPLNASLYAGGRIRVPGGHTVAILGNLGSAEGLSLADGAAIRVEYDGRLASWSAGQYALPSAPSRSILWREVY